jgi:outer membrane protein OmpA-like peptidoglycan-associated protein
MNWMRLFLCFRVLAFLLFITQTVRSQDTLGPTTNPYGTVGMSQIVSAEPLGAGRLNLQFRGNFYEQKEAFVGTPAKNDQITTATFGAALGLNPYIDGFIGVDAYNIQGNGTPGSGLGTTILGAQGSLPLPEDQPVRLGLQIASLFGTAGNQINTMLTTEGNAGAYGYNYLETRKFTDFSAKLTQSLIFMGRNFGVKFHFNEGVISSFQPDKSVLLVTGAGMQITASQPLVLGLEVNDRTFLDKPENSDPLWVSPSLTYRSPVDLSIELGGDASLSKNRYDGTRTLEPWRAFGALSLSLDTQAGEKRREAEKAQRDSLDRVALEAQARMAQMSRDSVIMAEAVVQANQKAINDSLLEKSREDSIALFASQQSLQASQQSLAEEISKRSEAEKQLLSTGLLLLDAVYFESGKTEISINSKPYLNIIAKMLTKYPKLQIEVSGHTDSVGGADYNMRLSQGRAEAVMQYMLEVAPDFQGRLSAKGYGSTEPKASNATPQGRKLNRRTELEVLNKDALKEYNP